MADISDKQCMLLLGKAVTDAGVSVGDSVRITHRFIMSEHGAKNHLEAVQYWNGLTNQQKVDLTVAALEFNRK